MTILYYFFRQKAIEYYDIFIDCLYYGKCLGIEPIQDIEWLFGNAKSVYQKSYGTNHNKYAELLYHYANWTQNVDSAAWAIQKYVDIYHKNFVTTTSFLSENKDKKLTTPSYVVTVAFDKSSLTSL